MGKPNGWGREDGKDYFGIGNAEVALPPLPAEKPPLIHGFWSDVNLYPVIVNFSHVIRWMWTHWGEGGGGSQQESVEFDLRTYFGVDSLVSEEEAESANVQLVSDVIAAVKAGKKVYLLDTAMSTDLGTPEFKYEVDLIHEKTGDEDRDFFTAHGAVIIAGEAGAAIPKLVCQVMSIGDTPKCYVSVNL